MTHEDLASSIPPRHSFHLYGEPLRKTLHAYWKLRIGGLSGGKIVAEEVWILGIIHRKKVYEAIKKRL